MAAVQSTRVPVPGGRVPVRLLVPGDQLCRGDRLLPRGWVGPGGIEEFDDAGPARWPQRTGCAVLLVDYRLAPEYRFPTAVEDAWAALRWADAHLEELAGARVPLIVAGDGAGGNLAAVMARARPRQPAVRPIALQVLVYPITDCDLRHHLVHRPGQPADAPADSMTWFWAHYAPVAAARAHPDASPLRQPDPDRPAPRGHRDGRARRPPGRGGALRHPADEGGGTGAAPAIHGQMHGFFAMIDILPGSRDGLDFVADAVGQFTSAPTART